MRQQHQFVSEIRLWNTKWNHKRSIWVMISLPVWMIFSLVCRSVTSVREISFDLIQMILHLFDDLNDGNKTNQESFTATLMSSNAVYCNGNAKTRKTHKSSELLLWDAWPLTPALCSGIKTGRTPGLQRAVRSVATRTEAPDGAHRYCTARLVGARRAPTAEAETRHPSTTRGGLPSDTHTPATTKSDEWVQLKG